MAGKRSDRLREMAEAPEHEAPDLLGPDEAPQMDGHPPVMPQPCPVTPLGVLGGKLVFLDRGKQVVVAPTDCKKGDLKLWFGNTYLLEHFEQMGRGGKPTGKFDQDDVQTAFVEDCQRCGIFNPQGKVLGRGAHRLAHDESVLVLHMGREVLIAREGHQLGRDLAGKVTIGGKELFFPADSQLPPPAKKASPPGEARALLEKFNTWNWAAAPVWVVPKRPGAEEDDSILTSPAALLLLGWVAQAFICGALNWRSHVWLIAPTGSGKTSLQQIIRALLDEWCLQTADASEAGIRQVLGNDTLAVSIDEAEKEDNPERQQAVLNLMKKASSGDKIIRGSADHKAQEFTAQSAFLLSSVLHATLRGEDRNRIALLDMRPLPEKTGTLEMELARWRSVGRAMHRRMVEQWPRFAATLAAYKRAIGIHRYDGRWQDTFGTLLACADLLLFDHDPHEIGPWDEPGVERVNAAVSAILPLLAMGKVEARTDTERAIAHLLSVSIPGSRGVAPEPVGMWLSRAMAAVKGEFDTDPAQPNDEARAKLKAHGLRVVSVTAKPIDPRDLSKGLKDGIVDALLDETGWKTGYLAIAYPTNATLQALWRGTDWSGDGYLQSLRKLDGTKSPFKVRFGSDKPDNALLVPLSAFRGDEG